MRLRLMVITVATVATLWAGTAAAQTPRLVRFSSVVREASGAPQTGSKTVTFAIYADAEGGAPLWVETHVVTLDDLGRYAVLLGASAPEGLPLELFAQGDARWLGVTVEGGAEATRTALVSVPYALKAADAETLGGKPASAFLLAGDQAARANQAVSAGGAAIVPLATSGTPGYLGMFTSATDLGNSNVFQDSLRIGINTSAPAALFHVRGDQAPAALIDVYNNDLGALPLVYRAARGTPAAPTPVQTNDILGGLAVRGYAPSGFTGGKGQVMFRAAQNWTDSANGTLLQFMTTPNGSTTFAERMRITPGGEVLIGTSSSSLARLRVVTDGTGAIDGVYGETAASGGWGVRGLADNGIGVLGQATSGYGVYAQSSSGRALHATSSGTVLATFSGPGDVGIGTVSPADKLHVAGDIRIGTGALGCVKDADGSVIAGTCSSDRRLKHAVTPFGRSLDAVAGLQPVSFAWRADEFPDRHFGHTRSLGLIAQDVEAVLPDLVTTDAEGYKAVKYQQLPFYMLQAIKDLKAENDLLKAETDLLKQQLKMQEKRLQRLEQAVRR